MAICFNTPGEIDTRLITTLGTNVKAKDSPIGFFGTGLKYAIAILLREKQTIKIIGPRSTLTFSTQSDEIRGKTFEFIVMQESDAESGAELRKTQLGFTTELGKNWNSPIPKALPKALLNVLEPVATSKNSPTF